MAYEFCKILVKSILHTFVDDTLVTVTDSLQPLNVF